MGIRILVVDHHPIFAAGLRAVLNDQPGIEVVGEVADRQRAVDLAVEACLDLVLLEMALPGMNGIDAARQIRAKRPEARVLVMSMQAEGRFVKAALEAGAAGYLVKDCPVEELVRAIHAAVAGRVYLCPAAAAALAAVGGLESGAAQADSALTILTPREREVLQLLAQGATSKGIAERLDLSVKTVGTHRENIMAKLGIHSIAGLTKYAIRQGLSSVD